jgi:tRNA(Ile)-lysidine synthase
MAAAADDAPVTVAEAAAAFTGLIGYGDLIVAVSGGADSVALLVLIQRWAEMQSPAGCPRIHAVTVDHGLRAGSAAEAERVANLAARLGVPHVTKTYDGPVPAGPFAQAFARDLRYRLLLDAARDLQVAQSSRRIAILTAHHRDDQAETFLMRLARGSGLHGLAGMREARPLAANITLCRPLLAVAKARLVATLRTARIPWTEDPSNESDQFERVRLRRAGETLARYGIDSANIARSASRLARADAALAAITDAALRDAGLVQLTSFGTIEVVWQSLLSHPEEIRLRLIAAVLETLHPDPTHGVSLGQLETALEGSGWHPPDGLTLHHCQWQVFDRGQRVRIVPELGRLTTLPVAARTHLRWCAFEIAILDGPTRVTLGPLGDAPLPSELQDRARALPAIVRRVQPALRDGTGAVLAVPTLGWGRANMTASPVSLGSRASSAHNP